MIAYLGYFHETIQSADIKKWDLLGCLTLLEYLR